MADTPDNKTPDPKKDKKKRRSPSPLNQAQARAVTKAEQIGLATQKAERAPKFAAREITAQFVQELLTDIGAARTGSATALQKTTGKEIASVEEDVAEAGLLKALQEVQAAAKQKYSRTQPAKLKDFAIGARLNANRPTLEPLSKSIIDALAGDSLPGITPVKITNLGTLRKAYVKANQTQGDEQADATGERQAVKTQVQSITDRRIQIQYAADAEWPHTDKANAGIRRAFFLPANKAFNG